MKCDFTYQLVPYGMVAPYTGAWIEITIIGTLSFMNSQVAPYTGAWIEIPKRRNESKSE